MITQRLSFLLSMTVLVISVSPAAAVTLFDMDDPIVAVDIEGSIAMSSYPDNEGPGNVADQDSGTKYLNFLGVDSGLIITPAQGASIIQSLQLTTANDARDRDPLTYELYGTNEAIVSADNSEGDQEAWTPISSGLTGLAVDPGRLAPGTIEDLTNNASYTSYKIIFPTNDGSNLMQVADISLFTEQGGAGTQILAAMDPALGIGIERLESDSNYPGGEAPWNALDGDSGSKYLNFAKENTGFIVSRGDGFSTIVNSLTFTTGGDAPERDPMTWELYGTDDPVTSADNSLGDQETWSLVDSGVTGLDPDPGRGASAATQGVNNDTAFGAYRLVFPTVRDADSANSMQIAEVLIEGSVVPEPSSLVLFGLALAGFAGGIRRR